jgi:hypothetical protein
MGGLVVSYFTSIVTYTAMNSNSLAKINIFAHQLGSSLLYLNAISVFVRGTQMCLPCSFAVYVCTCYQLYVVGIWLSPISL